MTGPEMRIGDAEREAAVQALGEHFAAGRLTKDEFDERSASAYAARTASALRPLFVDLPGPHPFAAAPRETRTGTPFNRLQYPSDVGCLVVLWRLRYKLSLRDLAEMFLERGVVFIHEAVWDWEAQIAPRC